MESKKYRDIMGAYTSIYEKKEEPEMEKGEMEKGESEKDEGGKHKEGKHPKGKEEKGEKVTEKEGKEKEKEMNEDKAYDRNRKRAAQRAEARNQARREGKTGSVPGVGYVSPRPERSTYTDSAGVVRHHTGGRMPKNEEVQTDLFDYILEHLVAEGYADTNKAALAIMANMSEEWKQSILEQMGPTDSMADKPSGGAKWNKGQKLQDPRAQKIYDRMTGPNPVKLPPA